MATITKKDLIDRIAESAECKRAEVKRIVQQFLDEMINELGSGNRLEFRDFGVFEIKGRAARVAQNPKTLQRVEVPPKRTVKFKVGRLLKERLEGVAGAKGAVGVTAGGARAGDDGVAKKPQVVVNPDVANGRIANPQGGR